MHNGGYEKGTLCAQRWVEGYARYGIRGWVWGMPAMLPGWYIAWYVSYPTLVGIHPFLPWCTLPLPGYTTVLPLTVLSVHHLPLVQRCRTMRAWAQKGRNPWVGEVLFSQILKGVKKSVPFCAELFRSPHNNRMNDRIDLG